MMTSKSIPLLREIITGATGMVGEGVAYECMKSPLVESILLVNRKPSGITHHKVTEVLHDNMHDLSKIEDKLIGYNACFFCLGISSIGVSKDDYYKITYELTMHFAQTLSRLNADMTLCYISGAGTNINGSSNWSRVKGKTENDLKLLQFKQVYNFRPAFMKPTPGLKNTLGFYKYITWMFPLLRPIMPGSIGTLTELGEGMINTAAYGYNNDTLDVKDIRTMARHQP
ncbi:Rossmann-fold NAD(P)-binding domain-containing protein [Mucilaginibacter aquatilis]|nr:epimerase [Mucilaginibacter aquatilis]